MAFVLINVGTGYEREVVEALRTIPGVKEANLVKGVYDIIALLETETTEELKNIISWKIRRLEKVRSTIAAIVVGQVYAFAHNDHLVSTVWPSPKG